ncbi:hypothetical protein GCM10010260_72910 [Streptomyces filipinensis]|uniref:Transposase n=1 Tax=Streptomyces filipinensis TaxID=66887 RepID=A0A918IIL0_9ACTN|nr:hypothetical protein GCM10010260_72910 [Streptomyces filipinensis]
MLSEAQGIPLAVAVSGANTHDGQALKPLVRGIPPSAPGAAHVGADRSNSAPTRRTLPPATSPGCANAESSRVSPAGASSRVNGSAGTAGRSKGWLFGYRRHTGRYERKGSHFVAYLGLAAALTCSKKLAALTT